MEVIYYMRNYYPLTAAQKMHHSWILDYGTQQVSGVSVVASVQAELDFGLLKKCIQMETERSGCTRIRFTKPDKDGNVQQYLVKQDPRDIGFKDLSGMGSLAKADELMQQWAYETFDGDDIPMCEFTMLKLPEGYNGFFVHMDHRLIDSCGLVVMIGDLFQLYTYYKYGTAYPQELADFETVLKKDLAKAGNEKRFAKDKKFWDDQLDALGAGVRTLVELTGQRLYREDGMRACRTGEVLVVAHISHRLGENDALGLFIGLPAQALGIVTAQVPYMREVFDLEEVVQTGKQAARFDIEAGFLFGITTINAHFIVSSPLCCKIILFYLFLRNKSIAKGYKN